MSRLRQLEPPPTPVRYEKERAGELLRAKRSLPCDPMPDAIEASQAHAIDVQQKQGFKFVYVATDDFTRLSYVDILADERSEAASTFLIRAVEWFALQKIRVERVMTDNGSAFVSRQFTALCRSLQIRHVRIRPYTPRTNGKAERFIQTLLREWAYRFAYNSSEERRRWLAPYQHFYNFTAPTHRSRTIHLSVAWIGTTS